MPVLTRAEYQPLCIEQFATAVREGHRRVIIQLPTGAGKTYVAKLLTERALSRRMRVVFLARGIELVEQTAKRYAEYGVECGLILSGTKNPNPDCLAQVCSTDTLRARSEAPEPTAAGVLVISDECHRDSAVTRAAILGCYNNPLVAGLTATPERGDRVALGGGGAGYQRIISPVSVADLQELWRASGGQEGLVPLHTWSTPDNRPRTREQGMCESPVKMTRRIVLSANPRARVVWFCETNDHADQLADEFNRELSDLGIKAASIEGGKDRTGVLEAYARGEIQVLTNVYCLAEGWDAPVDAVGIARQVTYFGACAQIVGRGLRPAPGKTHCDWLDPYGLVYKGWDIASPRIWTLDGTSSKPAVKAIPLRMCRSCGCTARPAECCPRCGEEQPAYVSPKEAKEQARIASLGDLKLRHKAMWDYWEESVREMRAKGWAPQAAFMKFQYMWKCAPPFRVKDVP